VNIELPTEPLFDQGSGKLLILLQGAMDNVLYWKNVIKKYASTHRVLIPRLPLLSAPVSPERLGDLVEYLHRFRQERALDKAVLMGNVLGEQIAILYMMKYPEEIGQIILNCGSGYSISPADCKPGNIRLFEL
jgi:pimeloyl-ACP methyl ester carboxylesterase